jgi:hypothetical protein
MARSRIWPSRIPSQTQGSSWRVIAISAMLRAWSPRRTRISFIRLRSGWADAGRVAVGTARRVEDQML